MPEIYTWQQDSHPETGQQLFSVVDGQQRLSSLRQFIAGEWFLKKSALDKKNRSQPYVNKSWADLDDEHKNKIWDYHINIRAIPNSVDIDAIHEIFTRLNQTDKSLNPQEMRNAKFHGNLLMHPLKLLTN